VKGHIIPQFRDSARRKLEDSCGCVRCGPGDVIPEMEGIGSYSSLSKCIQFRYNGPIFLNCVSMH
jgi:hypothetical protein